MAEQTLVQYAVKVYTTLLWLYPRAHRQEYGTLMVQLFRDQCRDAYAQRRAWGLLGICLRTLWDLCLTAFQEHLQLASSLGLANQQLKPLPWSQVLLAILPGLWIMVVRADLIPWLWGWRQFSYDLPPDMASEPYVLGFLRWLQQQSWIWLACGLLAWSWWRHRRLARWVYPIAGLVVYGLPTTLLSIIFHQDGTTPLSPFGRIMMGWWLPIIFVGAGLVAVWFHRRRIRVSIVTWVTLGIFGLSIVAFEMALWIYIAIFLAVPAALGLVGARRDNLYATLFVFGIVWWFVDAILDPTYGLLLWADAYEVVRLVNTLPALFILVLPVLWVLRARSTHQQLAGMLLLPFIGILLTETARFLVLFGSKRPLSMTEWTLGLVSAVQVAIMLALVSITYAQFDKRSEVNIGR